MEQDSQKRKTASRDRLRRGVLFALFAVCAVTVVLFSVPDLFPFSDETAGRLTADCVPRLALSAFLVALLFWNGMEETLKVRKFLRGLLWSVPCFLVAAANFPFTALLSGSAKIGRVDLLWLFLLKCLSVALMEELFFRALLLPILKERIKGKYSTLLSVLLSTAIFSLSHLVSLFFGGGVGETFLQAGYTFLLGGMFAVLFLHTGNIWLCVGVHFLFDVGGMIVPDLGSGAFQDVTFWCLTAVAAAICAAEVLTTFFKMIKKEANEAAEEKTEEGENKKDGE